MDKNDWKDLLGMLVAVLATGVGLVLTLVCLGACAMASKQHNHLMVALMGGCAMLALPASITLLVAFNAMGQRIRNRADEAYWSTKTIYAEAEKTAAARALRARAERLRLLGW